MIEDYTTTLFGYTPNKVVSRMEHLAACSILFPNLGNSQTELLCLHSSTVLFCLEVIKAQFPQFPLKGISRVVVHVASLPLCILKCAIRNTPKKVLEMQLRVSSWCLFVTVILTDGRNCCCC